MASVSHLQRPEFSGFEAFYVSELAPLLAQHEVTRRAALFNGGVFAGSLGMLALVIAMTSPLGAFSTEAAKGLAFAGVAVGAFIVRQARRGIASDLMPRICERLGLTYNDRPQAPYVAVMRELGLTPQADKTYFSSEIVGERGNVRFTICHARMVRRSTGKNRSQRTVFAGQLMVLNYPTKFRGKTVVKRDLGVFNGLASPGREFRRVGMASNEFERRFEAWSTDQVEARTLLDPIVLERFLELERLYDGKNFRAAFAEGQLFAAIEANEGLSIGSMFTPLANPKRIENLLKEFDALFDLMDILVRPVDGKIDGAFRVDHVRSGG